MPPSKPHHHLRGFSDALRDLETVSPAATAVAANAGIPSVGSLINTRMSILASQAVLGGTPLGDDDEGFSSYGPARYFTAPQVAELAQALNRPGFESEAAARFDVERMSKLEIYPGWRASDADCVLEAFHRLRDFYSEATANGRAVVTCLV